MKTYTILNSEGNILSLEVERDISHFTRLTLCANTNIGMGKIYFSVSVKELQEFFNSNITLSQIILNAQEDRFLLLRYDKGYIVDRSLAAQGLQCGGMLYGDILDDMKIGKREITKIISEIS